MGNLKHFTPVQVTVLVPTFVVILTYPVSNYYNQQRIIWGK